MRDYDAIKLLTFAVSCAVLYRCDKRPADMACFIECADEPRIKNCDDVFRSSLSLQADDVVDDVICIRFRDYKVRHLLMA